jgi:hypothetical protein
MVLQASTNVANMLNHPMRSLFVSAFWVTSPALFRPLAGVVVFVLGAGELCFGAVRTALLFVVGHVGATLTTVAAIAVGVVYGWLPTSAATAVDVGPSYRLAAVAAAVLARATGARGRTLVVLFVALALAVLVHGTPTDAGHLIAALLGLSAARPRLLFSPSRRARPSRREVPAPVPCALAHPPVMLHPASEVSSP